MFTKLTQFSSSLPVSLGYWWFTKMNLGIYCQLHPSIRRQGLFVQFICEIGMQKMVTGIVTYLEEFSRKEHWKYWITHERMVLLLFALKFCSIINIFNKIKTKTKRIIDSGIQNKWSICYRWFSISESMFAESVSVELFLAVYSILCNISNKISERWYHRCLLWKTMFKFQTPAAFGSLFSLKRNVINEN